MIECNDIAPLLSAFHDGELTPQEMLEVARHTAGCSECDATLAAYRTMGTELRESPIVEPPEWFALSVMTRIDRLRPSMLTRFGRYLRETNERIGASLSLGTAAVAIAVLTAVIVTPYIQRLSTGQAHALIASADHMPVSVSSVKAGAQNDVSSQSGAANDAHTVISRLQSENPAVAVWSEPRSDTTVIWLPDRQQ